MQDDFRIYVEGKRTNLANVTLKSNPQGRSLTLAMVMQLKANRSVLGETEPQWAKQMQKTAVCRSSSSSRLRG